jgi:hypothetical protein
VIADATAVERGRNGGERDSEAREALKTLRLLTLHSARFLGSGGLPVLSHKIPHGVNGISGAIDGGGALLDPLIRVYIIR